MGTDQSTTLAILGFHQIGEPSEWESWFYIPEPTFVDFLRYLRDTGRNVIDVATFLRGLENPSSLPKRSALLTFDDGCSRFMDTALPWLVKFGYPAVNFVPTDYIGKTNSFDAGNEPEESILSWSDLQKLENCGISIESHSVSHRPFSELSREELEEELRLSKTVLDSRLNKCVKLFAYPQGDEGTDWQIAGNAMRRMNYRAAFLYGGGAVQVPPDNPYRLSRLAMGPDSNLQAMLSNGGAGV
jgi:peptidoglycan/xylan/chitin deacetylase (PgdA/CDA1 family)